MTQLYSTGIIQKNIWRRRFQEKVKRLKETVLII